MKTTKRLAVKMKHFELVQKGKYEVAQKLFWLLLRGRVFLGCGNDASREADEICEKLDLRYRVNRHWGTVEYFI